jgi:transcriptional regulator with PAS, ATPase and Fis domain
MQKLRGLIERIGRGPAQTIMIYGETGTGKSFVSRMMHDLSPRASGRFVDVNCAAIPPTLVESELFGYTKGSFTGATASRMGLVEAANGGTLFLDEISELDQTMQAKLLTLLDTRQIRRVGGVDTIPVELRLVAATNRMLLTEVARGRFREDVFYRLQLVFIRIPPLRERDDDVLQLANHYTSMFGRKYGAPKKHLDPEVQRCFLDYHWPGNVRELAHLIERLYVLSDEERVSVSDLPPRMTDPGFWASIDRSAPGRTDLPPGPLEPPVMELDAATLDFQRRHIRLALERNGRSVSRAAEALGLTRHALRYRMMKLGVAASG